MSFSSYWECGIVPDPSFERERMPVTREINFAILNGMISRSRLALFTAMKIALFSVEHGFQVFGL